MNSSLNLFLIVIGTTILWQSGMAKEFIWLTTYQCEGKFVGNITTVLSQQSNENCSQDSIDWGNDVKIINGPKGEKTTFGSVLLSTSRFPAGADVILEALFLYTDGPLTGKFALLRSKHMIRNYLKKCSSVLGLSIIITKNVQLLISDNLSPSVLISPTGTWEAFKKIATTSCNGVSYGV